MYYASSSSMGTFYPSGRPRVLPSPAMIPFLEHALNRLMPATFVPLYDLVSFSTVPYAEAKARGVANDRAIRNALRVAASLAIAAAAIAILLVTKAVP